jgi:hypothetical protein
MCARLLCFYAQSCKHDVLFRGWHVAVVLRPWDCSTVQMTTLHQLLLRSGVAETDSCAVDLCQLT